VDANGARQPITTAPVIFKNATAGGFIVLFGTGKYLENNDDSGPFSQYSSFYGIWDKLDNQAVDRSKLMVQKVIGVDNTNNKTGGITVTLGSPAVTNTVRVTSKYVPNYTASDRTNTAGTFGDATPANPDYIAPLLPGLLTPPQRGWVLDFPNSGDAGTIHTVPPTYPTAPYADGTGEKVAFDPLILVSTSNIDDSKVVFTTLLPSTKKCDSGGTSFIMDLNPLTGSRLTFAPFDLNNDSNFSSGDEVPGYPGVHASGLGSTIGIVPQPTVIAAATGKEVKVLSGSSGGLMSVLENSPSSTTTARVGKRLTWRELLTD
jgi:type IV pilus assembly protein PilY1